MPLNEIYDPSTELSNEEQIVAARWELLRRNSKFQEVACQWIESRESRLLHANTPEYHDKKNHFPRCALDWMLTPSERMEVANTQLEHKRIFADVRYNFGPIVCRQTVSSLELVRRKGQNSIKILPIRTHTLLRLDDNWRDAPLLFKKQFRFAVTGDVAFQEVRAELRQFARYVRDAASRMTSITDEVERHRVLEMLFEASDHWVELAEFSRVFAVPNKTYTPAGLKEQFDRIRDSFISDNQFDPTACYNRHKSYLGSARDWKWFLIAERHGLDWRKSADLYKLAGLYSDDLKQQGRSRRSNAKPRIGNDSRTLRNRRSTVRTHCKFIHDWSVKMYPPTA